MLISTSPTNGVKLIVIFLSYFDDIMKITDFCGYSKKNYCTTFYYNFNRLINVALLALDESVSFVEFAEGAFFLFTMTPKVYYDNCKPYIATYILFLTYYLVNVI